MTKIKQKGLLVSEVSPKSNDDLNGNHHPNNTLNNLTGKDWLKFTKSWFIYDGPQRSEDEMLHPAKYPEGMIEAFIKFFTKQGDTVFDPFLGT